LSAFFPEAKERTVREIEKRSGYSHERVYTILNNLEQKEVLLKRRIGRTLLFSIRRFDDILFLAFINYALERKQNFVKGYSAVGRVIEEFIKLGKLEFAILFGSYSKDEAQHKSDIDILCMTKCSDPEKVALGLRHKHNRQIAPLLIEKDDFVNIRLENPVFWEELVKFGVIFKGYEIFFDYVYRWSQKENI
jgi:predicted nucleotidyltransferase